MNSEFENQLVVNWQAQRVRAAMRERFLSLDGLAKLCGRHKNTIKAQLYTGVPCRSIQWALERAFDFALPLWSPQREMDARARFIREFGSDPRDLGLEELKALCRSLGIQGVQVRREEAWFQALVDWHAAHPRPKARQNEQRPEHNEGN